MTQTNKQIVLETLTRINNRDFAGAAALLADDYVNHAALPDVQGRKGFVTIMEKLSTAFPDLKNQVEDVMVDGDRVVIRTTVTGTQTGPLNFTRIPLAATGKPVKYEQIHIFRVNGGKVSEQWLATDSLAMFRQLGLHITQAS